MKLAFVDVTTWDYTIDSAYRTPLGGSQSALCYLAEQLATIGHEVWLVNHASHVGVSRGFMCLPMSRVSPEAMQEFDVAIVLNWARVGVDLRRLLRADAKLVLWTQHADNQPAMHALAETAIRDAHDAFAFVSDWQRERYAEVYQVDPQRSHVLRNAIGPAFENRYAAGESILASKRRPPVLAYTSTPFRGLNVLLDVFPQIRAAVPGVTLKVYSSMQVYQVAADRDAAEYGALYEKCRTTEGVKYVGSLPQPELAKELADVSVLAYPNHFPETSCISVMEAMASGCHVVTSALGALPETTAGFGRLVSGDGAGYRERFVAATIEVARECSAQPAEVDAELTRQVAFINKQCTWRVRALEWQAWLASL